MCRVTAGAANVVTQARKGNTSAEVEEFQQLLAFYWCACHDLEEQTLLVIVLSAALLLQATVMVGND